MDISQHIELLTNVVSAVASVGVAYLGVRAVLAGVRELRNVAGVGHGSAEWVALSATPAELDAEFGPLEVSPEPAAMVYTPAQVAAIKAKQGAADASVEASGTGGGSGLSLDELFARRDELQARLDGMSQAVMVDGKMEQAYGEGSKDLLSELYEVDNAIEKAMR